MIYKLTAYDLLCTGITNGNYYVTTDTKMMYADIGNNRAILNVVFIDTDLQRLNTVRPTNGTNYYVWETNTLWKYSGGWIVTDGNYSISSGYYHDTSGNINPTSTEGVVEVIDNNGLLRDGSVVIRDANRLIKGRVYLDDSNNLVTSSYLGGGLVFLPSGSADESGALHIRSANTYMANGNIPYNPQITSNKGELVFYGDMFVTDGTNRFRVLTIKDGQSYVAGNGIILGDTEVFVLTYDEPSDWATNYNDYYHKVDNDYVKNSYSSKPSWVEDTYYFKDIVSNQINIEDYNKLIKGVIVNGQELETVNNKVTIPNELPTHSSSDIGKVLSVSSSNGVEWKSQPNYSEEVWTFTLENGNTITRKVVISND